MENFLDVRDGVWLFRPFAGSPLGLFAPWFFCLLLAFAELAQ